MKTKRILCISSLILVIVLALTALTYYFINEQTKNEDSSEIKWGRTVQTNSGSIRGIISRSRDGREFEEFLKIPYAQPPVGQLRFSTPKPIEEWEGVRDGSVYGDVCAQLHFFTATFVGQEDCLFLNVHVPKIKPDHLLPVFVFIHGGSFVAGSASDVKPVYFMDEDVVVITLNYRVGVLGFLTTGDKNVRGNMGLKDQSMALKWVKENVEFFGGDHNSITIVGVSAGAASVHYLTLSQSTRGLFSKAIAMGGTALQPWAFAPTTKAIEKTRSLGQKLHCPTEDSYRLTQCLRSFQVRDLLEVYGSDMTELALMSPSKEGSPIVPTVEVVDDGDAFLAQHPYDVIVQGKAHRIPFMGGVVRDEGLLSTFEFYRDTEALDTVEKNWDKCIQNSFSLANSFGKSKADEISRKIRQFYFPPGSESAALSRDQKISKMTQMYSDGLFLAGVSEVATIQRRFSPIYLYYYNVTGGLTYSSLFVGSTTPKPVGRRPNGSFSSSSQPRDYGISHAEDSAMFFPMFGYMKIDKDVNDRLYNFSKDLIRLFVSFGVDDTRMKFRDQKFTPTPWNGDLMYLRVDEVAGMIPEPFKNRTAFWHSINYAHLFSSGGRH